MTSLKVDLKASLNSPYGKAEDNPAAHRVERQGSKVYCRLEINKIPLFREGVKSNLGRIIFSEIF